MYSIVCHYDDGIGVGQFVKRTASTAEVARHIVRDLLRSPSHRTVSIAVFRRGELERLVVPHETPAEMI